MSDFDTVRRRIDGGRLTALLTDAVATYSPSFAEEPVMEIFADAVEAAGLAHLRQPVPGRGGDQRGNLIVEVGPPPAALLWVGHVDTVPPMDEEQLTPRVDGDVLHGLGSADMKSGCAAAVEALVALAESGVELKRGLALALVVGEEEYGDGSEALIDRIEGLQGSGAKAPVTVIGEPTGLVPCLDHYGYFEYELAARGSQVHAALPELGASAIHAMLAWLTAVFEDAQAPVLRERLALNPRQILGGGDMFVVAKDCSAFVDIHGVPDMTAAETDALVTAAQARAAAAHPGCALSFERVFAAPGYAVAGDDARLGPVAAGFRRVGLDWQPAAFRSHSDGALFHTSGSLPVVCGPGRLEVAHTADERVSLDETRRAAELYAAMFWEACCA